MTTLETTVARKTGVERRPQPAHAPARPARRTRLDWFWLVIAFVPPFLIFPNLDANILWQDEAETALLGRRITEYGYPLADDQRPPIDPTGHSVYTITDQERFIDINEDGIWTWTSWFGNYMCATSMIVFHWFGGDQSTYAARFPFAIAGWGVLFLMYVAVQDITHDRLMARVAVALLIFCVPYLLFARQCRSYTFMAMFTLMQTWGYIRMLRGQRWGMCMFVIGGAGAYYCFFPQMVGTTTALGAHQVLRHFRWSRIWRFTVACVGVGALTLPFFVYTASWDRDYVGSGFPVENFWRFVASLRAYLVHIQMFTWPYLLVIPLAWTVGRGWNAARWFWGVTATVLGAAAAWALVFEASRISFLAITVLCALLIAGGGVYMLLRSGRTAVPAASGENVNWRFVVAAVLACSVLVVAGLANHPFFRYLVGLMPLFALATAAFVLRLTARRRWALAMVLPLMIGTELFHYGPVYAARRLAVDPRLYDRAIQLGSQGEAYYEMIDFGDRNTNGYTWTMIFKNGRWDSDRESHELEFPLYNLIYELTHDYEGPIETVIRYLNEHADPGDSVVTVYEHFPLKFYTDFQVFRPWETFSRLWDLPDWIVRQHVQYPGSMHPRVREERYTMVNDLPGKPAMLQWDNIPEPPWHFFRTVDNRPDTIKLWRLRDEYRSRRPQRAPDTLTKP